MAILNSKDTVSCPFEHETKKFKRNKRRKSCYVVDNRKAGPQKPREDYDPSPDAVKLLQSSKW